MIGIKWVIKENDEYHPIVNNGAYNPFKNVPLKSYVKGKTIKDFIDPNEHVKGRPKVRYHDFHRPGFHFWKEHDERILFSYQRCITQNKGKQINCILKCFIRKEDIEIEDSKRIVAKKFRIIEEHLL